MSWSISFDENWKRDVGYGVPARCDFPGCPKVIDRGLSYVCAGEQPFGGDDGCGLYFCGEHMSMRTKRGGRDQYVRCCKRCAAGKKPYDATPDVAEWIAHKLCDPSWGAWRAENRDELPKMRATLVREVFGAIATDQEERIWESLRAVAETTWATAHQAARVPTRLMSDQMIAYGLKARAGALRTGVAEARET